MGLVTHSSHHQSRPGVVNLLLERLRQSLTARLLLLFLLTCLLIVGLLVGSLFHAIGSQWRYSISPHIEQYLDYVNEDLGYPPDQQRAIELAQKLPINIYIIGPGTDFSTNGRPLDTADLEFENRRNTRRKHFRKPYDERIEVGEHDDRTVLRNNTGEYSVYYELQHGRARSRHKDNLWVPLSLLVAILGGCYLVIRRMLRPVQDIKQAVHAMGAGDLDTRVPVRSNNDLGVLSSSINTMASDIEKLLNAKRQLLLGASHELRTPVTRAKIAAQMLDESENQKRIIEDLDEMESLIADIMESERVTGGHSALNITRVDTKDLITSVIHELRGSQEVETDFAIGQFEIDADTTRLRLLLRNLISNALYHGQSEKPPLVRVTGDDSNQTIAVVDYGRGIPKEVIDKVTEPFFRADPSRARTTGGFGLGLHICDLIVQAHGGQLDIESKPGAGTTVMVTLPRVQAGGAT